MEGIRAYVLEKNLDKVLETDGMALDYRLMPTTDLTEKAPIGWILASLPSLDYGRERSATLSSKLLTYLQKDPGYLSPQADVINACVMAYIDGISTPRQLGKIENLFYRAAMTIAHLPEHTIGIKHLFKALRTELLAYHLIPGTINSGLRPNGEFIVLNSTEYSTFDLDEDFVPLTVYVADCVNFEEYFGSKAKVFRFKEEKELEVLERLKPLINDPTVPLNIKRCAESLASLAQIRSIGREINRYEAKYVELAKQIAPYSHFPGVDLFTPYLNQLHKMIEFQGTLHRFTALKASLYERFPPVKHARLKVFFEKCLNYKKTHGSHQLFLRLVMRYLVSVNITGFGEGLPWHEGEKLSMLQGAKIAHSIGLTLEDIDKISRSLDYIEEEHNTILALVDRVVSAKEHHLEMYKRLHKALRTEVQRPREVEKSFQRFYPRVAPAIGDPETKSDFASEFEARNRQSKPHKRPAKASKSRRRKRVAPPPPPSEPKAPELDTLAPKIRETDIRRTDKRVYLFDRDPDQAYYSKYGAAAPGGQIKADRISASSVPYDLLIRLAATPYAKPFPFIREDGSEHMRYLIPGAWKGKVCFFEITVDTEGTVYHCVAKTDFRNSMEYMQHLVLQTAHAHSRDERQLISKIRIDPSLTEDVPHKVFEGLTFDAIGTLTYGEARFFKWPEERGPRAGAGAPH
ncbi:MAG: hypothetical protein MRY21_06975 [Simkaniaceae bacterium]|nr:hypothetical protein [Simkaniaceae bacterium]